MSSYVKVILDEDDQENGSSSVEDVVTHGSDIEQINEFQSNSSNLTAEFGGEGEYIFDRLDVRATFIVLYSIVFCCCFFGK